MKKQWIALLLVVAVAFGAAGTFAVFAEESEGKNTVTVSVSGAGDVSVDTESGTVTVTAEPAGSLSFDSIAKRVLEKNYTALSLSENIAILDEIDYKKLKSQLQDGMSEISDAQWALNTSSNTEQMQQLSALLDSVMATGNPNEQILAGAVKGLQTGMTALQSGYVSSTDATLQAQYDALEEQFKNIKNGKLEATNDGVKMQLKAAQNQMVMAAQTLYITLLSLERSDAALTRSLETLDTTVTEMNMRYQMGQISALTLQQVTAGRDQLLSGQQTVQMNISLLRMQLNALLGEELDTVFTLQPLGEITQSHLDGMNLAGDLEKSKAVSYDIYSAKLTLDDAEDAYNDAVKEYGKNSTKMEFTQAKHTWQAAQYTYDAALQSYELSFRTLFMKVKDAAQILAAAKSNLSYEQAEYNAAAVKYSQGSISANALQSAADSLSEAKDTVASKESDLFSAYITYQWAVQNGILN